MKTSIRDRLRSPWFVVATTSAVAAFTFCIGQSYGLTRNEWPGWLQAVGSIFAILVAVWVPWQQVEQQRRAQETKDADELRGILQCVHAELFASLLFAEKNIGPAIQKVPADMPIRSIFPMAKDPFPIYSSLMPQLGKITDSDMRRSIVLTFTAARSFVLTIRYHNELVEALDRSEARHRQAGQDDTHPDTARETQVLVAYSKSLRGAYSEAMEAGTRLTDKLRKV